MANVLYPNGKENLLNGVIDLVDDTIKVAMIDTGTYTYSATHEFYDDLSGVVDTPVALTTKSTTDGVFDADDAIFSAAAGDTVEALVIYKDTGTPSTSPLIAYIDTGTNLPVTPNGGDITIQWSSESSKIFSI